MSELSKFRKIHLFSRLSKISFNQVHYQAFNQHYFLLERQHIVGESLLLYLLSMLPSISSVLILRKIIKDKHSVITEEYSLLP
jgi:hypothetical protein